MTESAIAGLILLIVPTFVGAFMGVIVAQMIAELFSRLFAHSGIFGMDGWIRKRIRLWKFDRKFPMTPELYSALTPIEKDEWKDEVRDYCRFRGNLRSARDQVEKIVDRKTGGLVHHV